MGGTFNPIHLGHIQIAKSALEQFDLSKIWFMPNKIPEYKTIENIVEERHRVSMINLAIEGFDKFEFSPFELEREGYTYTYETLLRLKKIYVDSVFYFIMGADSLITFPTWKNPSIIAGNCVILAALRDDIDEGGMDCKIEHLKKMYNAEIYKIKGEKMDISSNNIRKMLSDKKNVSSMLPQNVLEYIKKHKLYDF